MSFDPQRVGRYGKLVELWAEKRYPIDLEYPMIDGLRFDGTGDRGKPWDVKGSMVNSASRSTFKFWKDQHSALSDEDGGYILVWYKALEDSIEVVASRSIRARDLKIDNWTNPGETHHRSHSMEAQIPAGRLRP